MQFYFALSAREILNGDLRLAYEANGIWPSDAIPVTEERADILRTAVGQRSTIEYSEGQWIITPYVPNVQEMRFINENRRVTAFYSCGIQIDFLRDLTDPDVVGSPASEHVSLYHQWRRYRVDIWQLDIDAIPIAWPTVPAKIVLT